MLESWEKNSFAPSQLKQILSSAAPHWRARTINRERIRLDQSGNHIGSSDKSPFAAITSTWRSQIGSNHHRLNLVHSPGHSRRGSASKLPRSSSIGMAKSSSNRKPTSMPSIKISTKWPTTFPPRASRRWARFAKLSKASQKRATKCSECSSAANCRARSKASSTRPKRSKMTSPTSVSLPSTA